MKRMAGGIVIGVAASLALSAFPARAADDACHLGRASRMEMSVGDGGVTVPMTIDGRRIELLVDTGGVYSMLTEDVVASLDLKKYRLDTMDIVMWGGASAHNYVTARNVELGGLQVPEMSFVVMPDGHVGAGIGGILAPEVLRAYDVDFDFAGGQLSLFSPFHCADKVVYWANDWSEIDMSLDGVGHVLLPTTLDGRDVKLTMDTGSAETILSLEFAEHLFGFDEHSPLLKRVETEDGHPVYRYPFAALSFGGVTVQHPDILLIPDSASHQSDYGRGLLGTDVLRQLHLYVSYREKKLYVTAAGAHL